MAVKMGNGNWAVFGRAFWDVCIDIERHYELVVDVEVHASPRVGVFVFVAMAKDVDGSGRPHAVCNVQMEFPNAQQQSLEAFLYSLGTRLYHCVTAWHIDKQREVATRRLKA